MSNMNTEIITSIRENNLLSILSVRLAHLCAAGWNDRIYATCVTRIQYVSLPIVFLLEQFLIINDRSSCVCTA